MNIYSSVSVREKNKKWYARLSYKDAFGDWKSTDRLLKDATGKRDAKKKADALLEKLNEEATAMPNAPKYETIEDIFTRYLDHQLKQGEIEKSTYSNSLYYFKKYIKPYIGDFVFSSIDRNIINNWLTELYKLGLSQNTIHTVYARLKKVYNYYNENGELRDDPFKGVKMPKKGKPKTTHLTSEQMNCLLDCLYKDYKPYDPFLIGVLLAYYAGLRRGEICGLRWSDINFIEKYISIRTSVGVGQGLGDYTKSPKNESSFREFPIVPQLEKALNDRAKHIKPKDNWFVIGDETEFMRPQQFNRLFTAFVKRNNLIDAYGNNITPHSLRHNFATIGIKAGTDIASLSLMMGHASRAMTLDVYGDANVDALSIASRKLGESFRANTKVNNNPSDNIDKDK